MIAELPAAFAGPYTHASGFQQALKVDNGYGDVSYFSANTNDGTKITFSDASHVRLIEMRPDGWLEALARHLGEADDE